MSHCVMKQSAVATWMNTAGGHPQRVESEWRGGHSGRHTMRRLRGDTFRGLCRFSDFFGGGSFEVGQGVSPRTPRQTRTPRLSAGSRRLTSIYNAPPEMAKCFGGGQ